MRAKIIILKNIKGGEEKYVYYIKKY